MRLLGLALAAIPLALLFCSTSVAQTQLWYYCRTTHQFYPHTQRCPVPWRTVKPYRPTPLVNAPRNLLLSGESGFDDTLYPGCEGLGLAIPHDPKCVRPAPQPSDLRHGGASTEDEKAAGETAYNDCLAQPPSIPRPSRAFSFDSPAWTSYRQQWRAKCDDAEHAAIIQIRSEKTAQAQAQAEANRAAYEHRRAIEKAESKGYEPISSVKDLILDGKQLAARNAKVQITGIYRKIGEGAADIYDSRGDAYADTENKIPVLTDDAQRELRKYLMNDSCQSQLGCEVEVGGHMTMCKHLLAAMADYPEQPCLKVEVAIVYRPD